MADEMHEFWYEEVVHETDAAWLVRIDDEEVWLPKSQCELFADVVMVPEWLAIEKELI